MPAEVEVFLDGEAGQPTTSFRHKRYAALHTLMRRHTADVLASQHNASRTQGDRARERLQKSALAGAVGPEDKHEATARDRERRRLKRYDLPVMNADLLDLKQIRGGFYFSLRWHLL